MINKIERIKALLELVEETYLASNATPQQKLELLKLTNSNGEWFGSNGVMQYVSKTLEKTSKE